jgi:membrane-bound lytic murein transglycosylase D
MKTILIPILVLILTSTGYSLNIPSNKRIDYWIKEYSENRRPHFQASLMRSSLYISTIQEIFKKNNIPLEFSWLPFVESGFNCAAKSSAEAAGCWQFISDTGKSFGLKKGAWKDQRYDFRLSTIAAAEYLNKLYGRFGDWELAIAAYNGGPNRIRKEIKRSGKDFWKLKLKSETMDYVPKLFAVIIITRDLKKYGFRKEKSDLIIVTLKKGSHRLSKIAKILQVGYDEFESINPGYEIGYTPPGIESKIYLKKDWGIEFLEVFGYVAKKNAPSVN